MRLRQRRSSSPPGLANRLPLDRLAGFEGVGVYHAATQMEAQACSAGPVAVVGGGNSAGQAALFLSRTSAQVHIIIRAATLQVSMSRYLIDEIERNPRITVMPRTQVTALLGKDQLEGVQLLDASRRTLALAVRGLFVFSCRSRVGRELAARGLPAPAGQPAGRAAADPGW